MRLAYVDTSCLVALALGEAGAPAMRRRFRMFDGLVSSNLLEAEYRAAMQREAVDPIDDHLDRITWIDTDRPLSPEIVRVLGAGYASGADCWHLATALYFAEDPSELAFLTLDKRQAAVAKALGFAS